MESKTKETGDPYNAALAKQFRDKLYTDQKTIVALSRLTGIKIATLSRVLNDRRLFTFAQFVAITRELNMDPADVTDKAETMVAERLLAGGAGQDTQTD